MHAEFELNWFFILKKTLARKLNKVSQYMAALQIAMETKMTLKLFNNQ